MAKLNYIVHCICTKPSKTLHVHNCQFENRVSDHKRLVIFTFTIGAVVNCIAHVNEKAGSLREHLFPCSGKKNESHCHQWTQGIFLPLGFVCVYCCYSDRLNKYSWGNWSHVRRSWRTCFFISSCISVRS